MASSGTDEHSLGSEIDRPVTAAIDLGTSYSGFAFVFDGNIAETQVNKWVAGSSETDKAPTTVLLKPDKTFSSFGYEAESQYAELCENEEQEGWRYFQDFKLALYQTPAGIKKWHTTSKNLSRDMEILDTENKPFSALELFSIVFGYLKKTILEAVRLQRTGISDDDVMYVITVPAIWSDAAKQFMREAATNKMVGISSDQLRLVLEPEAAAVYCALRETRKTSSGKDAFEPLPVGHQYILADLGGGTVDIATHEIQDDRLLHELHVSRGDDLGGQYFNRKCLEFIEDIFGRELFQKWKATKCSDFLDLLKTIDGFKKQISQSDRDIKFSVSYKLLKIYEETNKKAIDILQSKEQFNSSIKSSKDGVIFLKHSFLRSFLEHIASGIEAHIKDIAQHLPNIKTVFLVGGLAKSRFIREFIELKFPEYSLVVPEDPGVAVLKGAVILGNQPKTIAGRMARFSYGIGVVANFVEGKHREDYKYTREGVVKCRNVFEKLIEKGQVLKYGDRFTTTTRVRANQPESKQQLFTTNLYQSTQPSPAYVTEEGCTKLGGFKEYPPEGGWPGYCKVTVEIVVGEAEFRFYVKDDIGRKYETKVDFLKSN